MKELKKRIAKLEEKVNELEKKVNKVKECAYCGKEDPLEVMIELKARDSELYLRTWHFCSQRCLERWLKEKAENELNFIHWILKEY